MHVRTAKIPEGNLITRMIMSHRLALLAVLFLGSISLLTQPAQAQAVTPSPTSLSFGVPTVATPPAPTSAPQTVSVSVASGTVTLGTITVAAGTNASPGDFATSDDICSGKTLTGPASCTLDVTFTPSQGAGVLESATLNIPSSGTAASVPLTGAYGAIKLFTPVDVALSKGGTSPSNPDYFNTQTIPLSCPQSGEEDGPGVNALLSSSPDGVNNILTDNYIYVAANGGESSNVCANDPENGNSGGSCFTYPGYQEYASSLVGQDPDNFVDGGNGNPVTGGTAGGVSPIDVSGFLMAAATNQLSVNLVDTGGYVASSTVFLVTNCTTPGTVAPGGSVSGNPITPSTPSSEVQTFALDTNPGNNISLNANYTTPFTTSAPTGTAPVVTDIGIDQATFQKMVANSSAAPALCLHLTGEPDPNVPGGYLCKAFLFQCPNSSGQLSGANCVQSPALYELRFDSQEIGPTEYANFPFAPQTGAALLEGPDAWVVPSSGGYATVANPPTSIDAPCQFDPSTSLANAVCPQDPLTEFYGAQDSKPGGGTGVNSIFVPAVNMPLPQTTVQSNPASGWTNSSATPVTLTFSAAPAACPSCATTLPLGDTFKPASIASETYGITGPGGTIPDPTFPITTDGHTGNAPACPGGANPLVASNGFSLSTPGISYVHYFATDCAGTEELVFAPNPSPTANWASFKTVPIGFDNTAPAVSASSCTPAPNTTTWYNAAVPVTCTATDYPAGTYSGFAPALANSIQGSQTETVYFKAPLPASGYTSTAVPVAPTATITDLAGNPATLPTPFTYNIDTVAPTISGPTVSGTGSYTVGQAETVKYGCSDGAGSGLAASGGCTVSDSAPGAAPSACALSSGTYTCTLDTSAAAINPGVSSTLHTLTVKSMDAVGNKSTASTTYTVTYVPVTLGVLPLPAIASPGKTLTFVVLAGDITPAKAPVTAYGVNITTQLVITNTDLGTGGVTAKAGEVTCTAWPCTVTPSSGAACTVTTTAGTKTTTVAISCPIGTLADLFSGKTAAGISIAVPIAAKAPLGSITTSGGITSASPYTGTTTFSNFPVPII
jgi:hypothetical protein